MSIVGCMEYSVCFHSTDRTWKDYCLFMAVVDLKVQWSRLYMDTQCITQHTLCTVEPLDIWTHVPIEGGEPCLLSQCHCVYAHQCCGNYRSGVIDYDYNYFSLKMPNCNFNY